MKEQDTTAMMFTGNPIMFDVKGLQTGPVTGIPVSVADYTGKVLFECSVEQGACIDVAEIADAYTGRFGAAHEEAAVRGIVELEPLEDFQEHKLTVTAGPDANRDTKTTSFYAIAGGVGPTVLRSVPKGSDIFHARFLRSDRNFFLTVRTADRLLYIPETELYPLYFVSDCARTLKAVDVISDRSVPLGSMADCSFAALHALDVAAVRELFAEETNCFPSVIDIVSGTDEVLCCRIVIGAVEDSRERRIAARFRNSLGVFELVDVTGDTTRETTFGEAEPYGVFDSATRTFAKARKRLEAERVLKVKAQADTAARVRLLAEMVASEEVWLSVYGAPEVRVLASVEAVTENVSSPGAAWVEISFTATEPEIGGEGLKVFPHVFTNEFNDRFN